MKLMQVVPRKNPGDSLTPNVPGPSGRHATASMLAIKRLKISAAKTELVVAVPSTANQPVANLVNQPEVNPEGRAMGEIPANNDTKMAMVDELDALDARLYGIGVQIEDLRKDYQALFRVMIASRSDTDSFRPEVDQNGGGVSNGTDSEESRSSYHSYPTSEASDFNN